MKEILLTSSVLILALAALRRLLRGRISLRLQYALWLLAAVRLLVPVQLGQSPISVLNLVPEPESQAVQPAEPGIAGSGTVGEQIPEPEADAYGETAPSGESIAPVGEPARRPAASWSDVLGWIWLAGCAGMALWFLWVNLRFRRRAKAGAVGVEADCPLPVFRSAAVPSPCLVGLVRPRIYLTPVCLESPEGLRHVLAHEETHWRHRDPWWALVRGVCLCLYWFNPLVWWAADLSRRDGELACDEGAIRRLGERERLAYGRTLVALAAETASPARLLQTATTMADRRGGLRERVMFIAKKPRMLAVTVLCLLLAVGIAVGCTFTGAGGGSAGQTLREKLRDLPEELSAAVEVREGTGDVLASYYLSADDTENGLGGLMGVRYLSPGQFEYTFYAVDHSGLAPIGRDEGGYYVSAVATDVQFSPLLQEEYEAAQAALLEWTASVILGEEGVEPFTWEDVQAVAAASFTYPGAHRWPVYYPHLADEGSYRDPWTLTLSQPASQGEGGIWCVERWQEGENTYLWYPPDTDLAAVDYYAQLQAQADAGEADWALDPRQVALRALADARVLGDASRVAADSLYDDETVDRLEEYPLWVSPSWEADYGEDGTLTGESGTFEIMGQKISAFSEEKEAYAADPANEAVMATGVKYFLLAAYGEAERCDAMEAQPVDESALSGQALYNRRPSYIHAPEPLGGGVYRLRLEYLLAGQRGDVPPEERQQAELEIAVRSGACQVLGMELTGGRPSA